jgi:hypothetical protein
MPHHNLARVCAATLARRAILSIALLTLVLTLYPKVALALSQGHASSLQDRANSLPRARAARGETIDETFPASVTAGGVYANESTGETPSLSANGRYVAFENDATNLGEQGPLGVYEGYVKDLDSGEIKLVSRANGVGSEPANEPGEATGVENLTISGDAQYVVFSADSSNLVSGLPPAEEGEEHPWHVYRRDLQTGETVLVDRVTGNNGAILGERDAHAEAISESGRYVMFRDHVEDLEDPSGRHEPGLQTVYVRDMQTGTTAAVSRASGPAGELANEKSGGRSISPDGRYVTFDSSATDLAPGMASNTVSQVYLRDLQTDTTTLLSKTAPTRGAPTGEPGNAPSEEALLAGEDGCRVAFESSATNLYAAASAPQIYLTDLCSTPVSTTLVSRADGANGAPVGEGGGATDLGVSTDGRYVLFEATLDAHGTGPAAERRLYVRDLDTGHTTLVDRASGAEGALANEDPEQGGLSAAISANGCRVAFVTRATNLAEPGPPLNEPFETYIRQLTPCESPAGEERRQEMQETHESEAPGNGMNPDGEPLNTGEPSATAAVATHSTAASPGVNTECVAPAMRALAITDVKRVLRTAHCTLGHVTYHYNAIPKGRLVEQSLHQGTIRPAGAKVNIWLSLGRHRRRPAPWQ